MRSFILALAILAAPAAAAEQQFDLICRSSTGSETRYRVDLARGEACSGRCEKIWKIGEVTTGQIKLIDKVPNLRGDLEERMAVSRITGEYDYYMSLGRRSPHVDSGLCEVAEFSGFPASMF